MQVARALDPVRAWYREEVLAVEYFWKLQRWSFSTVPASWQTGVAEAARAPRAPEKMVGAPSRARAAAFALDRMATADRAARRARPPTARVWA